MSKWLQKYKLVIAFLSILLVPTMAYADEGAQELPSTLEEFAAQDGVIVRPSGLMIKIIKQGDGGILPPTARAVINYEGRLGNGFVFDSSYERGRPSIIPVGGVIRGWVEALLLMQVGSKWEIAIPSDLAYGPEAQGDIPANSDLFFKMDLLDSM